MASASAALLVPLLACASARADDWLALHAQCEPAAGSEPPRLELLYPSERLPAVVAPGDRLVLRVRLPTALTPPPGIQQARALAGFAAVLSTRAVALPPARGELTLEQTVPVTNVRPDGATSLVYRVTLPIPPFLPEGSYQLALQTPFGRLRSPTRVLRIVAAGSPVRLAWLARQASLAELARAALPLDVMLVAPQLAGSAPPRLEDNAPPRLEDNAPPRDHLAAAPRLDLHAVALALRLGEHELLIAGQCAGEKPEFAREVQAVLARESRTGRVLPPAPALASDEHAPLDTGSIARLPGAAALVITSERERLSIASAASPAAPLELLLGAPDAAHGYGVSPASSTLAFRPLEPFAPGKMRLAARLRMASGSTHLVMQPRRAIARLRIATVPVVPKSGQPFTLVLEGMPPSAHAAFALDDSGLEQLGFGPPRMLASLRRPGRHPVSALAIGPDGSANRATTVLAVAADRRVGCSVLKPGRQETAAFGTLPGWLLALAMLKRPRSRAGGNTFGRELR